MPHFIGCALSLVGATPDAPPDPNRRFREGVSLARASGCEAVRLDGAAPGMRARELDRSGRREVAAILKRDGLRFTGIDLWIPEKHFADPSRMDRALEALSEACVLAGELARLTESPGASVSVTLPQETSRSLVNEVVKAATSGGVRVADFNGTNNSFRAVLGVGFDPAEELMAGGDPVMGVTPVIQGLIDARLSDASRLGRSLVGQGDLDVPAYRAVLESLAAINWVTVDVRTMIDPVRAARLAVEAWRSVQR